MKNKLITVFGGTGFLGRYVIKELAKEGARIQVVSRHANEALFLKTTGSVGQISLISADITNKKDIKNIIKGSYAVIDLVGILANNGKQTFDIIHKEAAENLAKICKKLDIEKFIYVSALGVDQAVNSKYAESKFNAEKSVLKEFPQSIIIRPGLIIGQEDNFFNRFAQIAQISPFLPIIGSGKTLFQPVYVADVAKAITKSLTSKKFTGKIIELAGSKIYSFKELLELLLSVIRKKRYFINIPFSLAYIIGWLGEFLPYSPFTLDQIKLLEHDNLIKEKKDILYFKDLSIEPTNIESIIITYLDRFV